MAFELCVRHLPGAVPCAGTSIKMKRRACATLDMGKAVVRSLCYSLRGLCRAGARHILVAWN